MRFTAAQRLRKQADFAAVRAHGRRFDCGTFILQIFAPERPDTGTRRLGVIASRRIGNAVVRNRAKRRFREVFRLQQEALPPVCDVVIVVRRSFERFPFSDLEYRFLKACRRLGASSPGSATTTE